MLIRADQSAMGAVNRVRDKSAPTVVGMILFICIIWTQMDS